MQLAASGIPCFLVANRFCKSVYAENLRRLIVLKIKHFRQNNLLPISLEFNKHSKTSYRFLSKLKTKKSQLKSKIAPHCVVYVYVSVFEIEHANYRTVSIHSVLVRIYLVKLISVFI